jgi:hypothetical protein
LALGPPSRKRPNRQWIPFAIRNVQPAVVSPPISLRTSPEARRAIQSGKLPRKVGLTVVRHDQQYELTL